MRALKLILPLIALGFIGYQLYDYFDTSQQNEITELNNQVVDELVALQDYVGGIELQIKSIFDPVIEQTPAHYDLLELLKGSWVDNFASARANIDAIDLPDTPEGEALRKAANSMVDNFEAIMPEYDELIVLIVDQNTEFGELQEYVGNTLLVLQAEQQIAIDAFTASQEAYLAE